MEGRVKGEGEERFVHTFTPKVNTPFLCDLHSLSVYAKLRREGTHNTHAVLRGGHFSTSRSGTFPPCRSRQF